MTSVFSFRRLLAFGVVAAALLATGEVVPALATPDLPTRQDPRLVTAFQGDRVWNGVATSSDGRVFAVYPQAEGPGAQVAELGSDAGARPFPNSTWNAAAGDVAQRFVHVNAIRVGPDGALWLVDAGGASPGKPAVKGGARLFRIDLAGNAITRIYDLGSATDGTSYVDDVRFHGGLAYLTDAGTPGLIVLDLATGAARRVLDHHPAATQRRPLMADGVAVLDDQARPPKVHADQLEVSPDGATLYFQPASGPMAKIATRWLDNPAVPAATVARHVQSFADTPTTGGTAIDANGALYVSDANRRRVLRITPGGAIKALVSDPRLVWVDAMWIDSHGILWMPAAQLNLTHGMHGGRAAVQYPVSIYKLPIEAGPPAGDHP